MSPDTMGECDPLTPMHYPPPTSFAIAVSTLALPPPPAPPPPPLLGEPEPSFVCVCLRPPDRFSNFGRHCAPQSRRLFHSAGRRPKSRAALTSLAGGLRQPRLLKALAAFSRPVIRLKGFGCTLECLWF